MRRIAKIKKSLENLSVETQLYIVSLVVAIMLSIIFVLTEYWQMIIIAGIIAGALNIKMKKGIYSGAIGVSIVWFCYMIHAILTRNAYANLDQFAAFIIGDLGYGWLLFIIILFLGALFGALGGAIGSGVMLLIKKDVKDDTREILNNKKQVLTSKIEK